MAHGTAESGSEISPGGRTILENLARGALSRDELGRRISGDPRQLDLDLMDLQLQGQVSKDRDGRMVKAVSRRTARKGDAMS